MRLQKWKSTLENKKKLRNMIARVKKIRYDSCQD